MNGKWIIITETDERKDFLTLLEAVRYCSMCEVIKKHGTLWIEDIDGRVVALDF